MQKYVTNKDQEDPLYPKFITWENKTETFKERKQKGLQKKAN